VIKQETRFIDDIQITTVQFAAMRGFTILGKLAKTIGPAISVLSGVDPETDIISIAPALASALKDLDPEAATVLAAEVLSGTTATINNQPVPLNSDVNINLVFGGKLMTMFRTLAFALGVNYSDFFSGIGPAAARQPTETLS
jgi:hypothetical protein